MFLLYFTLRHRPRPDRLNQPLEGPKTTPKRRPGEARDSPGGPQDGSKSAISVPRAPPGRPNTASERPWRRSWAHWHKRAARRPSKGHFGPPAGRFCTLRGSIFGQFSSLGKHSQSCPVGKSLRKPTPSTALPPCVTSTSVLVRRRTSDKSE